MGLRNTRGAVARYTKVDYVLYQYAHYVTLEIHRLAGRGAGAGKHDGVDAGAEPHFSTAGCRTGRRD